MSSLVFLLLDLELVNIIGVNVLELFLKIQGLDVIFGIDIFEVFEGICLLFIEILSIDLWGKFKE